MCGVEKRFTSGDAYLHQGTTTPRLWVIKTDPSQGNSPQLGCSLAQFYHAWKEQQQVLKGGNWVCSVPLSHNRGGTIPLKKKDKSMASGVMTEPLLPVATRDCYSNTDSL